MDPAILDKGPANTTIQKVRLRKYSEFLTEVEGAFIKLISIIFRRASFMFMVRRLLMLMICKRHGESGGNRETYTKGFS